MELTPGLRSKHILAKLHGIHLSNGKGGYPGCLVYIGNDILPSYVGIRIPIKQTSIMKSRIFFFSRLRNPFDSNWGSRAAMGFQGFLLANSVMADQPTPPGHVPPPPGNKAWPYDQGFINQGVCINKAGNKKALLN